LVAVEADCAPSEAHDEARWLASLALGPVPIVGIVAHAPLEQGATIESSLARLESLPLVVGVRRLLQHEPDSLLRDPLLVEGMRLLAAHGLTCDLCVTFDQLEAVAGLAAACPDTQFVLDHLGKPLVAAHQVQPWLAAFAALADRPNVSCKLSGLLTLAPTPWEPEHLTPYLSHAIELFGPERCLFGSDWPLSQEVATYERWRGVVTDACCALTTAEQGGVLGENAIRFYNLRLKPQREEEADARS
jgi:L-fuconolactonase